MSCWQSAALEIHLLFPATNACMIIKYACRYIQTMHTALLIGLSVRCSGLFGLLICARPRRLMRYLVHAGSTHVSTTHSYAGLGRGWRIHAPAGDPRMSKVWRDSASPQFITSGLRGSPTNNRFTLPRAVAQV